MNGPTNSDRSDWAAMALDTFAEELGMLDEDRQTQITDLLCDLMHLCDVEGISWLECINESGINYSEEIAEARGIDLDENGE